VIAPDAPTRDAGLGMVSALFEKPATIPPTYPDRGPGEDPDTSLSALEQARYPNTSADDSRTLESNSGEIGEAGATLETRVYVPLNFVAGCSDVEAPVPRQRMPQIHCLGSLVASYLLNLYSTWAKFDTHGTALMNPC
jgi:hypothetical protein